MTQSPEMSLESQAYTTTPEGNTVEARFPAPTGFERVALEPGSYQAFLRALPLKPEGAVVRYHDGGEKPPYNYVAVIDMTLGTRNLQQCADTLIRYKAEYLWEADHKGEIAFRFTSGFLCKWTEYAQGYRASVRGSTVDWTRTAAASASRETFDKYLNLVFNYAGTRSLESYETQPVNPEDLAVGDMFLRGGSPGHVVQVVDMAVNSQTGQRCMLLVQGYMPAQDGQILCAVDDVPGMGPWVLVPENPEGPFATPEYGFSWDELCRFK